MVLAIERLLHVIGVRQIVHHRVAEQRDGRNNQCCDYHAVQRAVLTVDLKDQLHVLTSFQVEQKKRLCIGIVSFFITAFKAVSITVRKKSEPGHSDVIIPGGRKSASTLSH